MPLFPVRRPNKSQNFNLNALVNGVFIVLSYTLTLLPLALFAIAQSLALFGKRYAFLLSFFVVLSLCVLAFITRLSPFILGAFFAVVSVPLFLIVCILRQKNTNIAWSASLLALPIILFFYAILSAPVLNQEQYNLEFQKIENALHTAQNQVAQSSPQNAHVYDKTFEQLDILKRDSNLQNFMAYTPASRMLYFIYGDGLPLMLGILLSFFASLFFLDFAFDQVEKLHAIKRYVRTKAHVFDASFLSLLKSFEFNGNSDENLSSKSFNIVKHSKMDVDLESNRRLFGVLRKPYAENTIMLREYIFSYTGKTPGWNLRAYQMPLILCVASIMVLTGTIFYFGSFQNILNATQTAGFVLMPFVVLSVLSVCGLSFLVLQGLFTALKWIPFGLLIFISVAFLVVSPYILIDLGPYVFLGLFGIIGLLDYLKK